MRVLHTGIHGHACRAAGPRRAGQSRTARGQPLPMYGLCPDRARRRGAAVTAGDPRSIPRIGARRLARGEGCYVDDVVAPDALHAAFVRSPVAHARIRALSLEAARAAAGVHAVYGAAELAALGAHPMPIGWTVH